jgi:hypothetical protein
MSELIKLNTAPVIEHAGLQGMGELVVKRIESLNIEKLVATPDSLKSIKDMRAKLNKEFKTYEEQRKAIKLGVSNPYMVFEQEYKKHISAHYSEADVKLKEKILSVESELKLKREESLKEFFIETCQANDVDFVTFNKVGLNITMSPSIKSYKEKITSFVEELAKDIKLIDALDSTDNYKVDVLVEYKKCLNLTNAIKVIKERKEAKLAEEQRRSQQKAEPVVEPVKVAEPEPAKEAPLQAPTVENAPEDIYEMSFSVEGTLTQLKALKAFLIEYKIEFKKL